MEGGSLGVFKAKASGWCKVIILPYSLQADKPVARSDVD